MPIVEIEQPAFYRGRSLPGSGPYYVVIGLLRAAESRRATLRPKGPYLQQGYVMLVVFMLIGALMGLGLAIGKERDRAWAGANADFKRMEAMIEAGAYRFVEGEGPVYDFEKYEEFQRQQAQRPLLVRIAARFRKGG